MLRKRKCKSKESEHAGRSKRQTVGTQPTVCIFCESETSEMLHEITTFNMEKSVKETAVEMFDSKLLVKLSGDVDLVATEGKYHLTCLTKFRNSYRAFQRPPKDSSSLSNSMQAKAQAYVELVMTIETDIEQGTNVFKLKDLYAAYEKNIRQFHIDVALNRTRLKEEILDHSQKYGIQEQYDGKHVIFIFPEGISEILQNACFQSTLKSEAMQLASVAKLNRTAMFQTEKKFKFEGKFPNSCQKDSVPYSLNLLVSMILNGPSQKNEENSIELQSCFPISQLLFLFFWGFCPPRK